jgi:hypothetical protein
MGLKREIRSRLFGFFGTKGCLHNKTHWHYISTDDYSKEKCPIDGKIYDNPDFPKENNTSDLQK